MAAEPKIKYASVEVSSSGDNTAISAVTGESITVIACALIAAGAVTVAFEDGAGGTALTGDMSLAANGGFVLPYNPVGWFKTTPGTLLNIELGGAVSVAGTIVYTEDL